MSRCLPVLHDGVLLLEKHSGEEADELHVAAGRDVVVTSHLLPEAAVEAVYGLMHVDACHRHAPLHVLKARCSRIQVLASEQLEAP